MLRLAVIVLLVFTVFLNCHGNQLHISFDSCMSCHPRQPNTATDDKHLWEYIINSVIELTSLNTRELCRLYNDFYEDDLSSVETFRRDDIPVRPSHQNKRNFNTIKSKLITMAMFYKLGNTRTDSTEGLTLPVIENHIQSLLCALEVAAKGNNPNSILPCFRSFKVQSRDLFNRAVFGKWMFAILRQTREDLCHIFNTLASTYFAGTLRCDQLPTEREVCLP